jgi:hypothetical protein
MSAAIRACMKKLNRTKLTIDRETLRRLDASQLDRAAGAATVFLCTAACQPAPKTFLCMPDTYYCPTYTCTVQACSASQCVY